MKEPIILYLASRRRGVGAMQSPYLPLIYQTSREGRCHVKTFVKDVLDRLSKPDLVAAFRIPDHFSVIFVNSSDRTILIISPRL